VLEKQVRRLFFTFLSRVKKSPRNCQLSARRHKKNWNSPSENCNFLPPPQLLYTTTSLNAEANGAVKYCFKCEKNAVTDNHINSKLKSLNESTYQSTSIVVATGVARNKTWGCIPSLPLFFFLSSLPSFPSFFPPCLSPPFIFCFFISFLSLPSKVGQLKSS